MAIRPAGGLPNYSRSIAARDTLDRRFGNAFVVADLNGDLRPDIAVDVHGPDPGNRGNAIRVYLQNPQGQFVEKIEQSLPTTGWTFTYLSGDVNEDSRQDIIMDDLGSNELVMLLGKGDGTFQQPVVLGLGASGFFTLADFNGDQHLDLAAGNLDGTVGVFLGNGKGGFSPKSTLDTFVMPFLPPRGEILTGDLNNDGRLDVAVSSVAGLSADLGSLDVFLGNGDGTFGQAIRTQGVAARRGTLGDFNGDGFLDFAGTRSGPSVAVEVWLGQNDGRFTKDRAYALAYGNVWMVRTADLNYDGITDLFVTGDSLTPMNLFLGRGDGSFLPRETLSAGNGFEVGVTAPEFVDLNGDGWSDLVGLASKPSAPLEEAVVVGLSSGPKSDSKRVWLSELEAGVRFVLEKSTNLVNWTPVATNWHSINFIDPVPGTPSQRGFYRTLKSY